jgi:hypothetical protein
MPSYIDAYGFIFALWRFHYFVLGLVVYAKRKIDLTDFPRIIAAAFFVSL